MRSLIAALSLASFALTACQDKGSSDSALTDVPAVRGSIAEFTDTGWRSAPTQLRLAVFANGNVALYQGEAGQQEVFVRWVATFRPEIIQRIRAISTDANLVQADTWEQMATLTSRAVPCSGQEPTRSLILRRNDGGSSLAQQISCPVRMNPSLVEVEGDRTYSSDAGDEVQKIFAMLDGLRQMATE